MTPDSYIVGLLGEGTDTSFSPAMHEAAADAMGLRYVYTTIDLQRLRVSPDLALDLVERAADLGFAGLNVTIPLKQKVMAVLDDVDEHAARIGAVNTITIADGRLTGHNTDWTGFRSALERDLHGVPMRKVVQLGAGGAGAAVGYALMRLGAGELWIVDREHERAEQLAQNLAKVKGGVAVAAPAGDLAALLAGADGLVNSSPIGMHGHPGVPLDVTLVQPRHWVADVIYRPLRTALVDHATQIGCRVTGGAGMAVGQAVDSFELFTGRQPDRGVMARQFERAASKAGW